MTTSFDGHNMSKAEYGEVRMSAERFPAGYHGRGR